MEVGHISQNTLVGYPLCVSNEVGLYFTRTHTESSSILPDEHTCNAADDILD